MVKTENKFENKKKSNLDRHPQSENNHKSIKIVCISLIIITITLPIIIKISIDISGKELISYIKDGFSYIGVGAILSVISVFIDRTVLSSRERNE